MAEIDKKASSTRYWRAKEPGLWGSIKHFFLVDREGFKPVKNEHGEYFYTPCKAEFDSEEERLADKKLGHDVMLGLFSILGIPFISLSLALFVNSKIGLATLVLGWALFGFRTFAAIAFVVGVIAMLP